MPLYDYQCPENGVIIEIHHRMADTIRTWGELCERSGHPVGDTPPESPVEKWVGAGNPFKPKPDLNCKVDGAPFRETAMAPMRTNKF